MLMPASSARWMIRTDSSRSRLPQAPNIIAPRQSGLTITPVRPRGLYSTAPDASGGIRAGTDSPSGGRPGEIPGLAPMCFRCERRSVDAAMSTSIRWVSVAAPLAAFAAFGGGGAMGVGARSSAPRPSVTIRVDDHRIAAPARIPAGYVDIHIVTSGKVHHHLAFWHLNSGVTPKRFIRVLKQ